MLAACSVEGNIERSVETPRRARASVCLNRHKGPTCRVETIDAMDDPPGEALVYDIMLSNAVHLGGLEKLEAELGVWPAGVRRVATALVKAACELTAFPLRLRPHGMVFCAVAKDWRVVMLPARPKMRTPVNVGSRQGASEL